MFQRLQEAAGDEGAGGGQEEQVDQTDESTEEEVQNARQLGWVPQEEFRGDPKNWRPAKEFLARGEDILPILKANNRKLHQQLSAQNQTTTALQRQLAEQQAVIDGLKEAHAEIAKDRREAQIEELSDQIATAEEAGDRKLAARLQAKLTNLTREAEEAEEEETGTQKTRREPTAPPPQDFRQTQWWQDWQEENPWYGQDQDRTELADIVSLRLRNNPANAQLTQKAFMDKVTTEVSRITGQNLSSSRRSRVEGGGSRNASGGGGGRSYADLPASAKAACDRLGKRLIGSGAGQFKDDKAWKAHYVKQYFGGDES